MVVLRHQLAILRRRGKRPRYTTVDRALLAAASRLLPPERRSCLTVSPQTLRRWHRELLEEGRRGRRRRPGRPSLPAETHGLIRRMARENPRWGYMRIEGELLKLGISVSATTIATVLRRSGLGPAPRRLGPSWSAFLRAQAYGLLGGDLHSSVGAGLKSDASARSRPAPDGETCQVEADDTLSPAAADEPRLVSRPLPRPRPLRAAAAARPRRDSRNARLRPSRARDGPATDGRRSPATDRSSGREAVAESRQRLDKPALGPLGRLQGVFTLTVSAQRINHHGELAA
jgi:transposase